MRATDPLMPFVRLAAGSVLSVALAMIPAPSFALVCNGGPDFSDVREKDGVLWVRGKFGQSASTSDMGKTWTIDERQVFDSAPFWKKSFIASNKDVYQNVPSAFEGMHVITKNKNAEFWEGSPRNLILFARSDQLFSFDGKLSYNGQTKTVSLYSGQIYGTPSSDISSEIRLEISESYLCKITREHNDYICRNPFTWDLDDRAVTGFYARKDGNFFLSTKSHIYYFDARADKWSTIYEPHEWSMRCPSY